MRRARGAREVLVGLPLVFAMLQSLSTAHVRPGGTETALPWTDGRSVGRMRSPPASSLRLRGGTSAAEVDGRADAAPDEAGGSGTRTKEAKSGTIKGTDKSRERRAGRKNTRIAGATAEKHPSASAVLVSKSTAAQSETAGSNPEAALPEPEGAGQAAAPAEDEEAKRKREKRKRDKMKKKQRNKIQKQTKVPFRPWIDKPAPGEALAPDLSVYDCWFPLKVEWPALTFDIMEDAAGDRKSFPVALTIVAGTQALAAADNYIVVMDMDGLRRFRKRAQEEEMSAKVTGDSDESSDPVVEDASDSSEHEVPAKGVAVEPRLRHYRAAHDGTVNKLVCMPQRPSSVATFSDTGKVHVYDMAHPLSPSLVWTSMGHGSAEGYALGWSPTDCGLLASGDCQGRVLVHRPPTTGSQKSEGRSGGGVVVEAAEEAVVLEGHTGSVECLAWSPTEKGVLVTASSDRSMRFWEVGQGRGGGRCVMCVEAAHEDDINCLSWNEIETHLLVSGGEDGAIKVWDLRSFKAASRTSARTAPGAAGDDAGVVCLRAVAGEHESAGGGRGVDVGCVRPVAVFTYHKLAITSLMWHSHDSSMFLAASRDESISIWDVSVEKDEAALPLEQKHGLVDLPAQLLFLHLGQEEVSEVRWHPLMPSLVIGAAAHGFEIWRASTL